VAAGYSPGMLALIGQGSQAEVLAVGRKSLQTRDAMRRDSIFRIASMTKPITAAVAIVLVEEGKPRLDEPVERLLPEFANRRVLKRRDGPLDDSVAARQPLREASLALRTAFSVTSVRCELRILLCRKKTGWVTSQPGARRTDRQRRRTHR
jgi:hypothetical protein